MAAYRGRYDEGWEALRRARYERQLAAGLFDREETPLPANSSGRSWAEWGAPYGLMRKGIVIHFAAGPEGVRPGWNSDRMTASMTAWL